MMIGDYAHLSELERKPTRVPKLRICFFGHPRVSDPLGHPIDIRSKKGIALLALLATARHAERSRVWLQEKLWGTRDSAQAKASLRRELANLRKSLGSNSDCLIANHRSIRLDSGKVSIELFEDANDERPDSEFLEGLDIPGEDGFEDWLREARGHFDVRRRPGQRDACR